MQTVATPPVEQSQLNELQTTLRKRGFQILNPTIDGSELRAYSYMTGKQFYASFISSFGTLYA